MTSVDTSAVNTIKGIGTNVKEDFERNKRVLSFAEYMDLVEKNPDKHLRSSAQYLLDMFDFYGTNDVDHPSGKIRRFKLFDCPWDESAKGLIGQEEVQNHIYRILKNFVRQGRVDRFILLHGPNGSSKSTVLDVIAQAMEDYSAHDEGALYRFNWIFPAPTIERSGIGFSKSAKKSKVDPEESYAHLDDSAIDARMPCEQKDHPFLLIPMKLRRDIMNKMVADQNSRFSLPGILLEGEPSHKSKMIYEALLNAYEGDYLKVLRHVQVERFYVSRRYREAVARVEPQLAVDARTQQITADRSLAALPSALQNVSLYETDGQLVRGNRGMIDFADMLKRPLEAFKYMLTGVEEGRVALDQANLYLDLVFTGSANETHLNAFMQSPEWMSFKARFELVRVPYLLDFRQEESVYELRISEEEAGKPISPHAIEVAALWAVLTRMHPPDAERYEGELQKIVKNLTPMQKLWLYAEGKMPEGLDEESRKVLRAAIPDIYRETLVEIGYEGRTGASAREVRTAIMNAAQNPKYKCLSPESVLNEIAELCKEESVYPFLRQEAHEGYFKHASYVEQARSYYLDIVDNEVRHAMGLVEESRYGELFERYVKNVTHYVRKEKILNDVTGKLEDADERLMSDVEDRLDIDKKDAEEYRQTIMTKIGAWSIDNKGERPDYTRIFSEQFDKLRQRYFREQYKRVDRILNQALRVLSKDEHGLDEKEVASVKAMLARLDKEFGYCEICAKEVIFALVKYRYNK